MRYKLTYRRTGDVAPVYEYEGTPRGAKAECTRLFRNTWNDAILQIWRATDDAPIAYRRNDEKRWHSAF